MPLTPETWLAEFTANTVIAGSQFEPRITQLSTGNILVAWTSDADFGQGDPAGTDILSQLFDPFGTPIGVETRLNGFVVDNERNFDLAALDNGRFVVVYEDENGSDVNQSIRFNAWGSDDTGIIFENQGTIGGSPEANDIVRKPTVTHTGDGGFVVGFEVFDASARGYTLVAVKVEPSGAVGNFFVTGIVNSTRPTAGTDSARLTDGNIVMTTDINVEQGIAFNFFNPRNGDSIAAGVPGTNSNGFIDRDSSVAALTGGGFVIAWENTDNTDTDIKFQRFANDGTPLGSVTVVDDGGITDDNRGEEIVALPDGGFIIFWHDFETGQRAGRGQRYDSDGIPVGSSFIFDSTVGEAIQATLLDDGRVALAWLDQGEIKSSIIDTRDAPNAVLGSSGVQTGTVGNDFFTAAAAATVVNGWDGNDRITEGLVPFSTAFFGGTGDDLITVVSGLGSNSFDGGTGNDTINWSGVSSLPMTFDLAAGTASNTALNSEVMVNFENLRGTNSADTITGTSGANTLLGNGGNDVINGAGGSDLLIGGLGDDSLRGGRGNDNVNGGIGNDTLLGGTSVDTIRGGEGDDRIIILDGEFIDFVFGDGGNDTLDLSNIVGIGEAVTAIAEGAFTGFGGTTEILGIEEIIGTQEGDVLTGFDIARGGLGDDIILGKVGLTILEGGPGDDTIQMGDFSIEGDSFDGGAGSSDTFDVSEYDWGEAVTIDLTAETWSYSAGSEVVSNFENILGAGGVGEVLNGNALGNYIDGFAGDDTIDGGGGNDQLRGGEGDDSISGGAGDDTLDGSDGTGAFLAADNDTLSGGSGNDRLIFSELDTSPLGSDVFNGDDGVDTFVLSNAGLRASVVDLAAGELRLAGSNGIPGGVWAAVLDIENVEVNGAHTVIGDSQANVLSSVSLTAGAVFDGGGGNDRLTGGSGDDILDGGDGADTIAGGAGNDTIVGGETAIDLRDVVYGGNGNDVIDGGHGNDELRGDAGNDSIGGGFGADTVIGGTGNDTLTGSAFGDLIYGGDGFDFVNGGFGSDRVNGGAGGDRFYHLGIADHGNDWIQDYSSVEGDILLYGGSATRDQFQVNITNTANAGSDALDEAFVIFRPTGQILWALVDGNGQDQINLSLGGQVFDLLG